jgi:hypothetical protein
MKNISALLIAITIIMTVGTSYASYNAYDGVLPEKNGGTGESTNGIEYLPHWNVALSKVLNDNANAFSGSHYTARVGCMGTSITQGYYSLLATATNNATMSWCAQLANNLQKLGINTTTDAIVGGAASDRQITDSRIVLGSWSVGPYTALGAGGYAFRGNSGSPLVFTPANNVNAFRVCYTAFVDPITVQIDSQTATTLPTSSTTCTVLSAGTVGSHHISFTYAGGIGNIFSIEAYDSTKSQIIFENAGWSGSTTKDWSQCPSWGSGCDIPADIMGKLGFDLIIYEVGPNDELTGNSIMPAQTTTNLNTIINYLQQTGTTDVALTTSTHINPTWVGVHSLDQTPYILSMIQASQTHSNSSYVTGIPIADIYSKTVSYGYWNSIGAVYDNGVWPQDLHPTYIGEGIMAKIIQKMIMP